VGKVRHFRARAAAEGRSRAVLQLAAPVIRTLSRLIPVSTKWGQLQSAPIAGYVRGLRVDAVVVMCGRFVLGAEFGKAVFPAGGAKHGESLASGLSLVRCCASECGAGSLTWSVASFSSALGMAQLGDGSGSLTHRPSPALSPCGGNWREFSPRHLALVCRSGRCNASATNSSTNLRAPFALHARNPGGFGPRGCPWFSYAGVTQ
jgi:hypothetical protein